MRSLAVPPLFAALEPARTVLIAGAGGGFDVYAAIPLAVALRDAGRTVQQVASRIEDFRDEVERRTPRVFPH
ncbi:hypothetical protein [Micromonospora sp. DT62]|uniref:hypothetical protein n=1 Tax=Micromonospora sp. DT62 TaxID=3416521 RepID=UPI003CF46A91